MVEVESNQDNKYNKNDFKKNIINRIVAKVYKKKDSMKRYIITFFKWAIIGGVTGVLGGLIGIVFHESVELATVIRIKYDYLILLLPLGGIIIAFIYERNKMKYAIDTNLILDSIRNGIDVPLRMGPMIFVSTVITHLFGGSSGREGAALQIGASIGTQVGKIFRLQKRDMIIVVMCGMSSLFSALFGTPLTSVFFAMEVVSVGVIHYSTFIPSMISSIIAYGLSIYFGVEPVRFIVKGVPDISLTSIAGVAALGAFCAVLSIIFCVLLHKTSVVSRVIRNRYLRILTGGVIIVAITYISGTRDYNGAGMNIITDAINGHAVIYAFLMKMIFTVITIGFGYKGGEIVPTFFIGATFGCVVAPILGLNPSFGAAVALTSLFCGVTNTLITSIVLSIELFGAEGLLLVSIACGISYMFSGYYSLYGSQKIMYSKLRPEYINRNAS